MPSSFSSPAATAIVLYDGVCGLCNRLVQFILKRDRKAVFRFASLQSEFAARVLQRHGVNPTDLDTVYIVVNHGEASESLLPRSEAVIFVLITLGSVWRVVGWMFRVIPRVIRDWIYGVIARNRYRVFGHYESCPVPDAATRSRFLDQ